MHKFLSWGAVLVWMGFIFHLSHQPAEQSSELSDGVAEVIVTTIEKVVPNAQFEVANLNHIVRKNAHFFIYLVLGLLVLNALRRMGMRGWRSVLIALVISILYAISDEVHQQFVPGRSAEVRDVLIDTVGAMTGIGIYMLLSNIKGRLLKG